MACEELIYVNYEHDTDAVSVGSLSTVVSLCDAVSAGMREMSSSWLVSTSCRRDVTPAVNRIGGFECVQT